jgi:PKD repeat protein
MKRRLYLFLLLLWLLPFLFGCYREEEIPVQADFGYTVVQGCYTVPVEITLNNQTTGADFFQWTFEGAASAAASKEKQPGTLTYRQAGTYTIRLEAWNDTQRKTKEIVLQLDSAVRLQFNATVLTNDFVPATVQLTNQTLGASFYEWTFEGGSPATATESNPPPVRFNTPGPHTITLRVSNGRETFSSSQTLQLKPALTADFAIVPSFEDEDYEAPLTAMLDNRTISGLHYTWSSTGGIITHPDAESATIYFDRPGTYGVSIRAGNDKETQIVERQIEVKPNRNLYVMSDVKLGISAAHGTIGCFYAPQLRSVLTRSEVNAENGKWVDLVFFGINSGYNLCRFLSPDSAAKFSFPAIPLATHTYVVNVQENSPLSFTSADFDAMNDDVPLRPLAIREHDTGTAFFNAQVVPRVILFETGDGRKGAIKIKAFVSAGNQSYILADIKIQKSANG